MVLWGEQVPIFMPADLYWATIFLLLSLVAGEVLLGGSRWQATPVTRAKVALPLWALAMALYLLFRMAGEWGVI